MAAPIEKGLDLEVGIGVFTQTGFIVNTFSRKQTGESKVVLDEDAAAATIIITNRGTELNMVMIVKASSTLQNTLRIGDTFVVDSINYRTTDSDLVGEKGTEQIWTVTAIKEDSITYPAPV